MAASRRHGRSLESGYGFGAKLRRFWLDLREMNFVISMGQWSRHREPTPAQCKWLHDIAERLLENEEMTVIQLEKRGLTISECLTENADALEAITTYLTGQFEEASRYYDEALDQGNLPVLITHKRADEITQTLRTILTTCA